MPSDEKMSVDERRKYLKLVAPRYAKARRAERSALLTEMAAVTGLHRPDASQYCSLRYYDTMHNSLCGASFRALWASNGIPGRLAFSRIPSSPAGYNSLFQDFIKHSLMEHPPVLRGKKRQDRAVYA